MDDATITDGTTTSEPTPNEKLDTRPWLARIAAAEKLRDKELEQWKQNVRSRVQRTSGPAGTETSASDRLAVPEDWARTKQKAAQLNYQIPKIVAKSKHPTYEEKAPVVTADINDVLRYECKADYMMDECLADVINAAGIMVSMIGIDRQTETVMVEEPMPPTVDALGNVVPSLEPPRQVPTERIVSQRFYWDRVSPADFLRPAEFRSSNWSQAPWLGTVSYWTPAQVRKTFKDKLPPGAELNTTSRPKALTDDLESQFDSADGYVKVTQIWYYAWLFDPDKAHPECIRRIVFVDGVDDPVEFEQTDWQEWVDEIPPAPPGANGEPATPGRPGYYRGLRKLPIRVETLTYVSDMAVPPSDTEAGRPQVRELLKSRSQMLRQRDHSIPVRWYNVNLVDPEVATQLERGEWQDFIPMNGQGDRAIGEVARAQYPRENFQFQSIIGNDLDRAWSLSNNQLGMANSGTRSATEVGVIQSAGQVRLDYEKSRVNRYLVEGAEVLFSLMQRFRDGTKYVRVATPEGDALQEVSPEDLLGEFMLDIMVDSGDRIDTATKQVNALKMYNLMANSPGVNRQALERELFELHGLDPAKFIGPPPEPKPEPPNISYRFSGEDLLNPMAVAVMVKSGNPLTPEDIKAAVMMIQDSVAQMKTLQAQAGVPGAAGAPPSGDAPPVEPPETVAPILKRGASGERLL